MTGTGIDDAARAVDRPRPDFQAPRAGFDDAGAVAKVLPCSEQRSGTAAQLSSCVRDSACGLHVQQAICGDRPVRVVQALRLQRNRSHRIGCGVHLATPIRDRRRDDVDAAMGADASAVVQRRRHLLEAQRPAAADGTGVVEPLTHRKFKVGAATDRGGIRIPPGLRCERQRTVRGNRAAIDDGTRGLDRRRAGARIDNATAAVDRRSPQRQCPGCGLDRAAGIDQRRAGVQRDSGTAVQRAAVIDDGACQCRLQHAVGGYRAVRVVQAGSRHADRGTRSIAGHHVPALIAERAGRDLDRGAGAQIAHVLERTGRHIDAHAGAAADRACVFQLPAHRQRERRTG